MIKLIRNISNIENLCNGSLFKDRTLNNLPVILINGTITPKTVITVLSRYSPFMSRPITILMSEISFLKNQNSCTTIKGRLMPKRKNNNSKIARHFFSI